MIWIGTEGEICYSCTEVDINGTKKDLTRETAIYHIRQHISNYDQLLRDEHTKKRKADHFRWAFNGLDAGVLKKYKMVEEDNMRDLLETDEELALYDMKKRLLDTPLFEIAASADGGFSYFS